MKENWSTGLQILPQKFMSTMLLYRFVFTGSALSINELYTASKSSMQQISRGATRFIMIYDKNDITT